MPSMRGDEVVEALTAYGPSAVINLCLPSSANSIRTEMGRVPAPYRDPRRDCYLATALAVHLLGDWVSKWKKIPSL